MPTTDYIALLRSVNVGGKNKVGMADLRAFAGKLGLREAQTVLQSGNLLFKADGTTSEEVEERLEAAAVKGLGLKTAFFVRTQKEWAAVIKGNPFPGMAEDDPSHLVVLALKKAPAKADVEALRAKIKGPEEIAAKGKHLYVTYPAGIGTSKLTIAVIEKALGTEGTGRNWNTVVKLSQG